MDEKVVYDAGIDAAEAKIKAEHAEEKVVEVTEKLDEVEKAVKWTNEDISYLRSWSGEIENKIADILLRLEKLEFEEMEEDENEKPLEETVIEEIVPGAGIVEKVKPDKKGRIWGII